MPSGCAEADIASFAAAQARILDALWQVEPGGKTALRNLLGFSGRKRAADRTLPGAPAAGPSLP
jgi:hypothetical protein